MAGTSAGTQSRKDRCSSCGSFHSADRACPRTGAKPVDDEELGRRITAMIEQSRGDRNDDECWPWVGVRTKQGYARYGIRKVNVLRWIVKTPPGMDTLHSCDNKSCVNPRHLSAGTRRQNVGEAITRGLLDNNGPRNPNSTLTVEQVAAIRSDPRPSTVVAPEYGVQPRQVRRIRQGTRWVRA